MGRAAQLPASAALMGWLWLALLAAASFGVLAVLRVPRPLWWYVGAAIAVACVGYAWQGEPALPAAAATPAVEPADTDAAMVDLREKLLGRFSVETPFLVAAEGLARSGSHTQAAQVLTGGLNAYPQSFTLWTALGNAIVERDGGQLSPAARLAFSRALALAPNHPAPSFYVGLAYARGGDLERARALWRRALVVSPATAPYRERIATLLAAIGDQPGG